MSPGQNFDLMEDAVDAMDETADPTDDIADPTLFTLLNALCKAMLAAPGGFFYLLD
jgi:hypothetical protein